MIYSNVPDLVSLATSNANFVADFRSTGFIFQFPAINFGSRVALAAIVFTKRNTEVINNIEIILRNIIFD